MPRRPRFPHFVIYEDPPPPFTPATKYVYRTLLMQNPDGTEPAVLVSAREKELPEYAAMKAFYDEINFTLTINNREQFQAMTEEQKSKILHLRIVWGIENKAAWALTTSTTLLIQPSSLISLIFDFSSSTLASLKASKIKFALAYRLIAQLSCLKIRLFTIRFVKPDTDSNVYGDGDKNEQEEKEDREEEEGMAMWIFEKFVLEGLREGESAWMGTEAGAERGGNFNSGRRAGRRGSERQGSGGGSWDLGAEAVKLRAGGRDDERGGWWSIGDVEAAREVVVRR